MAGFDWTFTQIGGPQKEIKLSGWAAPFGRPRRGPVVSTPIKVRQKTQYYPGNNEPTRHLFGVMFPDWSLSGRWMDYYGGSQFAQRQVQSVEEFVADQQECTIRWGNVLAFQGLIEEFNPKWEDSATVAWDLKILITKDENLDNFRTQLTPIIPTPQQMVIDFGSNLPRTAPGLKMSLLDSINNFGASLNNTMNDTLQGLESQMNEYLGVINSIAASMNALNDSALSDIKRFRASIGQVKTGLIQLKNAFAGAQSTAINISQDSNQLISIQNLQSKSDVEMAAALSQLEVMDRQALKAQRGKENLTVIARFGDTWESLSLDNYGTSTKADRIRQANGIRYGEQPTVGRAYTIPSV